MTRWNGRVDRGLGHLGLFLIGVISWLADRVGPTRAAAPADGGRIQPGSVARTMSEPGRTLSDARTGQRAA
jgi:hypothetical protein